MFYLNIIIVFFVILTAIFEHFQVSDSRIAQEVVAKLIEDVEKSEEIDIQFSTTQVRYYIITTYILILVKRIGRF